MRFDALLSYSFRISYLTESFLSTLELQFQCSLDQSSASRVSPLRFSCGSDSKVCSWNFQFALVSFPLLGEDFLQHFNLLVDIKGEQKVADFTSCIAGSTVFARLDLQKGYYQIPMASKDVPKTAIITPFVMFEFLSLRFDLRNTGNTFQCMMDLGNLPYCFVYIDDILGFFFNTFIFSKIFIK